jgi:hypothetical protein
MLLKTILCTRREEATGSDVGSCTHKYKKLTVVSKD